MDNKDLDNIIEIERMEKRRVKTIKSLASRYRQAQPWSDLTLCYLSEDCLRASRKFNVDPIEIQEVLSIL